MSRQQTRERILQAAGECLQQRGAGNVAIEDVAVQAGVHRQTVYRIFENREALFKTLLATRLQQLVEHTERLLALDLPLKDSLMRISTETIALARGDAVLMSVLRESHGNSAYLDDLVACASDTVSRFNSLYRPLYQRARARGEFVRPVSFARFSAWLRGVHYLLLVRERLSPAEERELLKIFFDPGFVR